MFRDEALLLPLDNRGLKTNHQPLTSLACLLSLAKYTIMILINKAAAKYLQEA